jgi:multidrug efflux pump subunit AcrA (membrane-fusion protein)
MARSSFYATTGSSPDTVETIADLIAQAEAAQAAAEAAQAAAEAAQAAALAAQAATEAVQSDVEDALDDVVYNADTSTVDMQFVIDEDNMSSNSATKIPTQQSVKAYVDANAGGGGGGQGNVIVLQNVSGANTITGEGYTTQTEWITGAIYVWKQASTNSGAATLSPDGLSAAAIKKYGSAVGVGDLFAGTWYAGVYDGTDVNIILSGAML